LEAIILAGGFGTRLKSLVNEVPKPIAPIGEKPFLAWLIDYITDQGINRIIISVGYKKEKIIQFINKNYKDLDIVFSIENEPLGTGGAIARALILSQSENIFVINGDTFCKIKYKEMAFNHNEGIADISMVLKQENETKLRGSAVVSNGRVLKFIEKGNQGKGLINCGIYYFQKSIFDGYQLGKIFSFEKDFLQKHISKISVNAYLTDEYFVDIGIPNHYLKAQKEIKSLFSD